MKARIWKAERAAVAVGADVRTPTGDSLNFIGSGAFGVKPFLVWSYLSRVSPHVVVGYEANGNSVIAVDIVTGRKEKLPSQLTYSVGADAWLNARFTVAADLVGQQVFQSSRTSLANFTEPAPCVEPFPNCASLNPASVDTNLTESTGTFNMSHFSLGMKFRPHSNFFVTGNVLIKLNDGGLRAQLFH